jgi:acetyl-CoA hydrolase
VDIVVHSAREPVEMPAGEPTETEGALAAKVAELIPDGATLQIGLGTFPGAVLAALREHNDLGVHSGLIGDGVADLVERGVITNAVKGRDVGVTVTGLLMGTRRLFDWADGNPAVALRSTDYTHAHETLCSLARLAAINTALEVDLAGQVNTETAGGRQLGAIGGILDFLRGASRSSGGLPIVALPATSRNASRIVPTLSGPATVGRSDVGIVVTEFGAVDLRGMSLPARRAALIEIADPAHRAWLEATDTAAPPAPRAEHAREKRRS